MTQPVGFIGLGLLGQAIALRLVRQGIGLVVWNREPERTAPLADEGAVVASSPREVAEQCSIVCLCVLNGTAVRDVVFGDNGVLRAGRRERTVIDFSTVEPRETMTMANEAGEAQLRWVDAPISGGPTAALDGGLTVMVGGNVADVNRIDGLLRVVAANVTHLGPVGSGQKMKVVNQALVGATFVMLAEALALAHALELPAEMVPQCLSGGLADSTALQRVWPRMVHEQFSPPTGLASQMFKDLKTVDEVGRDAGLKLPLLEAAVSQYARYVAGGAGAEETVSISRLYHPMAKDGSAVSPQADRPKS
jgi:3-hydroxyisobutyrate dehydrogenase